jgi:transposase
MPPSYVKPYVKRQKNDMADAAAICEAVTRPTMRFVEVKSPEQQGVMVLHRTRQTLIRQRTQLSNVIRGHMAEFGVVAPIGREGLQSLIGKLADDERVPAAARSCLLMLAEQLRLVNVQVLGGGPGDHGAGALQRNRAPADGDPGRRPAAGERLVAAVPDPHAFRSGPEPGGLDRAGAATELQRRQGATGRDHQGWRPLPAPDAGRRGAWR